MHGELVPNVPLTALCATPTHQPPECVKPPTLCLYALLLDTIGCHSSWSRLCILTYWSKPALYRLAIGVRIHLQRWVQGLPLALVHGHSTIMVEEVGLLDRTNNLNINVLDRQSIRVYTPGTNGYRPNEPKTQIKYMVP